MNENAAKLVASAISEETVKAISSAIEYGRNYSAIWNMTDEYVLQWQQTEQIAKAVAKEAQKLIPEGKHVTLQLTAQVSPDGEVTVYSPAANGVQVPVWDSETDVWAGFRTGE
jgi:hypothetical protein